MTKDEKAKRKPELKKLMDNVNKYIIRQNRVGTTVTPQDLYWELFDFEEWLRMVYDRAGYQTRRKDDVTRALK